MIYLFDDRSFMESIRNLQTQLSYRQYAFIDNHTYTYMYYPQASKFYLDYIFLYYLRCLRPAFKYQIQYGINFNYPTKVKLTMTGRWVIWNLHTETAAKSFISQTIYPKVKRFKKYLNKLEKNGMQPDGIAI